MLGPPVSQVEQKSGCGWSDKEGAGLVWVEVQGGEEGTRLWKVPGERAGPSAWCEVGKQVPDSWLGEPGPRSPIPREESLGRASLQGVHFGMLY